MAPAHLSANGALVDHLTINGSEWAYCPLNVRIDGHDWKPTGGVTMTELGIVLRRMRERAGQNGHGHNEKNGR